MFSGRQLRVIHNNTLIAGARAESLAINRQFVDITDKNPTGVRELLERVTGSSVDISVSGVLKNRFLLDHASNLNTTEHLELDIRIASLGTFSGRWAVSSFSTDGSDGSEPISFSTSFQSSGDVTFEAGEEGTSNPSAETREGLYIQDIRARDPSGTQVTQSLFFVIDFSLPIVGFSVDDFIFDVRDGNGNRLTNISCGKSLANNPSISANVNLTGGATFASADVRSVKLEFPEMPIIIRSRDATGALPLTDTGARFPPVRLLNGIIQ